MVYLIMIIVLMNHLVLLLVLINFQLNRWSKMSTWFKLNINIPKVNVEDLMEAIQ